MGVDKLEDYNDDDFDRWRSSHYVHLLFSFPIYTQKCQNIILGHLRTVNGELYGSYREKISFCTNIISKPG